MDEFRKLGISEPILKAIRDEGFEKPTEVQAKSIPVVIEGKDVIAESATGSGKTLAFGCAIIQNCEKRRGIQALIMTPTRELAEQVSESLKKFSKYNPLRIVSVYGGVSISPQIEQLRSADVVVGTPGRLLDHIERNTIKLDKVNILVLDEADRMLDMGFIDDVEKIMRMCQRRNQTMLFSATISSDINHLIKKYMKNPVRVSAGNRVDPTKMTQVYYDVKDNLKFSFLVHLLKNEPAGLVMVFCNSRHNTDFVAENLEKNGVNALSIHGGFSQAKRNSVMKQFHSKTALVLVCTDVAARGLDIKEVSHVYNYDIPRDSKEYVHRIGRTARAGSEGKVVNILSSKDYDNFSKVVRDTGMKITKEQTPYVERVFVAAKRSDSRDRSRDGRGSQRSGFGSRREARDSRGGFRDRDSRDRGERSERKGFSDRGNRSESSSRDSKPFGRFSRGNEERRDRRGFSDRPGYNRSPSQHRQFGERRNR